MRQLRFAHHRTPTEAAAATEALRWLERQAVLAGCSPDLYVAELVPHFRYFVSVARQYHDQGVRLLALVQAGYRTELAGLVGRGGQPVKADAFWNRRMRREVLNEVGGERQRGEILNCGKPN